MKLLDREIAIGLHKLCEGKKNHAVNYLIFNDMGAGEDCFFGDATKVMVTVTDSIKLGGFGVGVQGFKGDVPLAFESGFVVSPSGRLLNGSKQQHATMDVPHPASSEDWSPFLEGNQDGIEQMRQELSEVVNRTTQLGQRISDSQARAIDPILYFLAHPPLGR